MEKCRCVCVCVCFLTYLLWLITLCTCDHAPQWVRHADRYLFYSFKSAFGHECILWAAASVHVDRYVFLFLNPCTLSALRSVTVAVPAINRLCSVDAYSVCKPLITSLWHHHPSLSPVHSSGYLHAYPWLSFTFGSITNQQMDFIVPETHKRLISDWS